MRGSITLLSLMVTMQLIAHSGGTDRYGCHGGSKPYHCHTPKKNLPDPPPNNKPKPPRYPDIDIGKSIVNELGILCRRAVRIVEGDLGGMVYDWAYQQAWRRRAVYYFRQWFSIQRYSGTMRPMRITCSYNAKTKELGEGIIEDV